MSNQATTEAAVISELARNAVGPFRVNGTPILIVPPGHAVQSLDHLRDEPLHPEGEHKFASWEALVAFVREHDYGTTTLFMDADAERLTGFLDYHRGAVNGRLKFKVRADLETSEAFQRWKEATDEWLSQDQLAELIERSEADFVEPKAAAMLTMAENVSTTTKSAFRSSRKLANGNVELSYTSENESTGNITIPTEFSVAFPVWRGRSSFKRTYRLRYRVGDGAIRFRFSCYESQAIDEAAWRDLLEAVVTAVPEGAEVYEGS